MPSPRTYPPTQIRCRSPGPGSAVESEPVELVSDEPVPVPPAVVEPVSGPSGDEAVPAPSAPDESAPVAFADAEPMAVAPAADESVAGASAADEPAPVLPAADESVSIDAEPASDNPVAEPEPEEQEQGRGIDAARRRDDAGPDEAPIAP